MSSAERKSELLSQLTITRDPQPDQSSRSIKPPAAYLIVAIIAVVTAFLLAGLKKDPDTQELNAIGNTSGKSEQVPAPPGNSGSATPRSGSVLDATGYVIARRSATVSAKTTGKVAEVLIEEGMRVSGGQVIARLDDTIEAAQLRLAQAQVDAALAGGAELDAEILRARADLKRWRTLVESSMASESHLDHLEAELSALLARQQHVAKEAVVAQRRVEVSQIRVDDLKIRAPFSGIVVNKSAQPGEMISPVSAGGGFTRTGICTIVDMDSLEVEVDVNESYINRVSALQPVEVRLNAYPEAVYPGQVLAVIPTADRNKATIRVRLRLLETDQRVLPEMGVRVAFLQFGNANS